MKPIRVKGDLGPRSGKKPVLEFHYIGGTHPYLRIGNPTAYIQNRDEFVGCIDGRASITKLRDYLSRALRPAGKPRRKP